MMAGLRFGLTNCLPGIPGDNSLQLLLSVLHMEAHDIHST